MIHLLGAAVGFATAVLLLKKKWVDCENWDLFAVLKGTHGSSDEFAPYRHREAAQRIKHEADRKIPLETPPHDSTPSEQRHNEEQRANKKARMLTTLQRHLENGSPGAALREFHDARKIFSDWQLPENDLSQLADAFYKKKAFDKAAPLMEEFIERFPDQADRMRLRLAAVAVEIQKRPQFALRILSRVKTQRLTNGGLRRLERTRLAAERLVDDGVIELDGQAWA